MGQEARMRRALAVAAALAVVGCKEEAPPVPAGTVVEWAQQSPDGRFEVRQRREGSGCRVQAVVKSADGERTLWSTQTCLPTPSALTFLSPNGDKLLVLDLFPSAQAAQTSDWSQVPLVSLWVRGAVIRQYTGAEILPAEQITHMTKVLSWVRGDTLEEARKSARASTDGERVTVDLIGGQTLTLDFEGNPLPAPVGPVARPAREEPVAAAAVATPQKEPTAAVDAAVDVPALPRREEKQPGAAAKTDAMAADEQGLYRWEDEQGGLHFGVGSQVPARFRKRARPVDADVGVVPLDAATPPSAGAQPAGRQPAAGGQQPATPARKQGEGAQPEGAPPPAPPAEGT
jgi:hypothetical protein